jgi:hypothetical protein
MITPQGTLTHGGGLSSTASYSLSLILPETPQHSALYELPGLPRHASRLDYLVGSCVFDFLSPTRPSVEELMSALIGFLPAKKDYSCRKNPLFPSRKDSVRASSSSRRDSRRASSSRRNSRRAYSSTSAYTDLDRMKGDHAYKGANAIESCEALVKYVKRPVGYSLPVGELTTLYTYLRIIRIEVDASIVSEVRLLGLTSYLLLYRDIVISSIQGRE